LKQRLSVRTARAAVPLAALSLLAFAATASAAGTTRYVAPGGSGTACTSTAPCGSFDAAYKTAALGDTVEVAAGTYGNQTVLFDPSKTGASDLPDVLFRPALGAGVTVNGNIDIGSSRFTGGASHATFERFTVNGDVSIPGCGQSADGAACASDASAPGNDLTFRNLRVKGPYSFYCASCSNVTIDGGTWGPDTYQCRSGMGSAHPEIQSAYKQTKRANHITIRNSAWQNFARCTSSDHTECLQVEPADYLTLSGNTFRKCDTIGVNLANDLANSNSPAGYRAPDHAVVENNFFSAATDNTGGPTYYALNIRECTNCLVRNNSWLQAPRMPAGGEVSLSNQFRANVGPMGSQNCGIAGVTYANNVWTDAKCSTTDRQAPSGFVNPAILDLHLIPGAAAIDAGGSSYPATDIDGDARPRDAGPDAGADEFGIGATSAPAPIPTPTPTPKPAPTPTPTPTPTPAPTPSTGPVGAWWLNEATGTTAADASGRSHTATLNGPSWGPGRYGGAATFDGINDSLSIADKADLSVNKLTLMGWVKPTALGSDWRTILLKEAGTRASYALYASSGDGKPTVEVANPAGSGMVSVKCSSTIATGAWAHVAGTYDGSALRVYLNGVECGSKALTGTIPTSTGALKIGGNAVWGEWFNGAIDAPQVFNRALSASEITAQM